MQPIKRSTWFQIVAIAIVIALGLLSRKYSGLFPAQIAKYPGSALWATTVFFTVGQLLRKQSTLRVGVVALAISTAVEFSQLLDIAWLNEIRRTSIGHLFLGSTFNAPDLLAYAIGIGIGCLIETLYFRLQVTR
jgi:Protein of unknown function (DUF2809)